MSWLGDILTFKELVWKHIEELSLYSNYLEDVKERLRKSFLKSSAFLYHQPTLPVSNLLSTSDNLSGNH